MISLAIRGFMPMSSCSQQVRHAADVFGFSVKLWNSRKWPCTLRRLTNNFFCEAAAPSACSARRRAGRDQMDLEGPDILQTKAIRRASEITAELGDGMNVGSLRRRRQIADRHVLDHAAAQRAHLGHRGLLS